MAIRESLVRWARKVRARGPAWAALALRNRMWPVRAVNAQGARAAVEGKAGLEIGGPSHAFARSGFLPIYDAMRGLDIADFAETTPWTESGSTDRSDSELPRGNVIVSEASNLATIGDTSYDFVLASHVLEHVADPISALNEWKRVLKPSGRLIIVLPDGRETFDRRRPITSLSHIMGDVGMPETDETHAAEVVALYDYSLSEDALSPEDLRQFVADNINTRFVHHHVFDQDLGRLVLEAAEFEVEWSEAVWPMHLAYMATPRERSVPRAGGT